MRRAWVFAGLAIATAGCKKNDITEHESEPFGGMNRKELSATQDAGVKADALTAARDAGEATTRVGCKDVPLTQPDGGLGAFVGFSRDEKQFAFTAYSEGAGATLLTVIETPSTMVKRLTLGGDKEEIEAKKLLDGAGFDSSGFQSDFDFKLDGAKVHVLSHGREVWSGAPFGDTGAGNVRVESWGCSRSRKRAAIRATISSGTEFGDIQNYVIFDLPESR